MRERIRFLIDPNMPETVKLLSIDGGGIRGVIPAVLLAEIEKRTGKPIAQLFHLIAGTSTGGILALALSKPDEDGEPQYSAAELISFYCEQGKHIFTRSLWRKLMGGGNLIESKFPASGIERVLDEFFGDARLSEAVTEVLVPSYEIERRQPFLFKSSNARILPGYDYAMKTVARATSAAPTYFEPVKIPIRGTSDYYALIDGGVYANNPALCAVVEARGRFPLADDFLVLSVGTGELTRRIAYDDARKWGVAGWAKPLLDIVFDGVSGTVDYQLRKILPNYYRFQPSLLPDQQKMDRTGRGNLRELKIAAEHFIRDRSAEIDQVCEKLVA